MKYSKDNLPHKIWPNQWAVSFFGIQSLPLQHLIHLKMFIFREPSGVIRGGVTEEFFLDYQHCFHCYSLEREKWIISNKKPYEKKP